jgi:hypothetical protein
MQDAVELVLTLLDTTMALFLLAANRAKVWTRL